jgi:ADP-heptose:LPS heptosyltransferase
LDILFAKYPQAQVHVLVSPRPQEIFQNNPKIKKVIVYDKHCPTKEKIKLYFELNREKFDMVLDLRDTAFGRILSAKYRVHPPFGFGKPRRHMKDKHLAGLLSFLGQEARDLNKVNK